MVIKKGKIMGCECSPLEKEIGLLNTQFSSGLLEEKEVNERFKARCFREFENLMKGINQPKK
mgnify:CR=1 FL=1